MDMQQPPHFNTLIDVTEKADVVARLTKALRANYCIPEKGEQIAAAVETASFDDAATLGALAEAVTVQLQAVNNDRHLNVRVTPSKQDEPPTTDKKERKQDENFPEWMLERFADVNYGIPKVEVLAGRVGYFEWPAMVQLALAKDIVISTLNFLSATEAMIVDLRRCGGGDPDTADLLYAILFDQETHVNDFYDRPTDVTKARVVGKKDSFPELKRTYFGKPVYVLTSPRTFSCGEEIAYTLKTFAKAAVVGTAKTGGGAHPGEAFYLHPYLGVFIPTGRNINMKTGTDWEGDGVAPDVQVATPEEGLNVAHALALKQILGRRRDEWSKKDFMAPYIQKLEAKLVELERANPVVGSPLGP
ncbi:Aste57867_10622 [Aphanomyces stellatus]|uniref:Aste57867_10622 protein n=1 Tax=Aphanomyces stellatus TaxID=120398 RepID=A0A485KSE3_9STRA|nr:hypothetical protein As57867_010582 [Aphanomyces stellatus]VFT87494.1 Aste57867_10622 [Aphanomyces stellatus]